MFLAFFAFSVRLLLGLPRPSPLAAAVAHLPFCYGLSHYNSMHARPPERWKSVKRRTPGQRV